jgi:hypothetical protein
LISKKPKKKKKLGKKKLKRIMKTKKQNWYITFGTPNAAHQHVAQQLVTVGPGADPVRAARVQFPVCSFMPGVA